MFVGLSFLEAVLVAVCKEKRSARRMHVIHRVSRGLFPIMFIVCVAAYLYRYLQFWETLKVHLHLFLFGSTTENKIETKTTQDMNQQQRKRRLFTSQIVRKCTLQFCWLQHVLSLVWYFFWRIHNKTLELGRQFHSVIFQQHRNIWQHKLLWREEYNWCLWHSDRNTATEIQWPKCK